MIYLIFCKQKTAYEMRICDWSSDVCSSDLPDHPPVHVVPAEVHGGPLPHEHVDVRGIVVGVVAPPEHGEVSCAQVGEPVVVETLSGIGEPRRNRERKSVLQGKRASVRVNSCGRRFIKKQKQITHTNN